MIIMADALKRITYMKNKKSIVGVTCGPGFSYWYYWSLSDSMLLLLVKTCVVFVVCGGVISTLYNNSFYLFNFNSLIYFSFMLDTLKDDI